MRIFVRTVQAASCLLVASARNNIGELPTMLSARGRSHLLSTGEPYKILTSEELFGRLRDLVANYPTFATLTTTQEWFGLPRAGEGRLLQ